MTSPTPWSKEAVEVLAERQFLWAISDRDAMACSWADCGEINKESWRKKAREDLTALEPYIPGGLGQVVTRVDPLAGEIVEVELLTRVAALSDQGTGGAQ